MREVLQESETNLEHKKRIQMLFRLFNMNITDNFNTNYAMLLFINNVYYKNINRVKEIEKRSNENIQQLYKYNKLKDTAQDILGKLAEIKGVTNKKISEEYNTPE
ncbi:hypothetical protein NEPAR04_0979 [Nematocida parisii]|nr:hypothetical protein NEPAR08_1319 [Nematocida parisii]KAI5128968.1 hypothetical protein NEPAR03_1459 [Nematocida parisii]KAI5141478.1 hypothetical protein NEPAR04_0979 [Nematocida parisii]KAI5144880.1 hypothetical protein NEPAR07_1338 [Nematocida parisii]